MNYFDQLLNRVRYEGGEGGGGGTGWLSSVPENLREHDAFKGVEKMSDAWQRYVDLNDKSKDALFIPGENATDDERNGFYSRLGRPEAPDGYELKRPEDLPEYVVYDDETAAGFAKMFHEANVPKDMAKKLHDSYLKAFIGAKQQEKKALDDAVNTLKNDPNWQGDKFGANTELAHRAYKTLAGDDKGAAELLDVQIGGGLKLGDHPAFLKLFHNISQKISDDSLEGGRGGGQGDQSEEERAKARFPNTKFK